MFDDLISRLGSPKGCQSRTDGGHGEGDPEELSVRRSWVRAIFAAIVVISFVACTPQSPRLSAPLAPSHPSSSPSSRSTDHDRVIEDDFSDSTPGWDGNETARYKRGKLVVGVGEAAALLV